MFGLCLLSKTVLELLMHFEMFAAPKYFLRPFIYDVFIGFSKKPNRKYPFTRYVKKKKPKP